MGSALGILEKPLSIEELQEDLDLRFEKLSSHPESNYNVDLTEDKALFKLQFKGKCRNCGN
jgi:hypothetical protein